MNFTIEQIVTWATMLVGLASVWFKNQHKTERLEEKCLEHERQIEALWKWKDIHEKDSATVREDLNGDIAEIRGGQLVGSEQFRQILSMLADIKERLTRLENGK